VIGAELLETLDTATDDEDDKDEDESVTRQALVREGKWAISSERQPHLQQHLINILQM
jgi:hypothetical protein